jgi:hypothetical protein
VSPPLIDPDARCRRLTALVNGVSLARSGPAVYVIEDAHWIDEVSESLVTEFLTVIPQTRSLVLLTYRPEYRGALGGTLGAQLIALAPLNDSEATNLIAELLGARPSVVGLTRSLIGRRAIRSSPRRSCATLPTGECFEANAERTGARIQPPWSACLRRCRRRSPRASTASATSPSRR